MPTNEQITWGAMADHATITTMYHQWIAQQQAQMAANAAAPQTVTLTIDDGPVQPAPTLQPVEAAGFFADDDAFAAFADSRKKARKVSPSADAGSRTMQDVIKYGALHLNKAACSAFEKGRKPEGAEFKWTTTNGYVGIEIEVENIINGVPVQCYWQAKQDGSLRNNGIEMVSQPLMVKQIQLAVEHVYQALNSNNKPDFSNRTSIHIHLNCRDMTQDQVYVLVLLYALFERHFYAVAGTKRLNSIFCVPIYRTNILPKVEEVIYGAAPQWHKYCGINLLPLVPNGVTGTYGTIEFRHLYGTNDQRAVLEWINDILCLRKAALTITKAELLEQIKDMNTTSSYMSLYSQVFAGGRKLLSNKRDFEDCVSNVKRELFGDMYSRNLKKWDQSHYWNLVRELGVRG